jgi:predicted extracellular nuclease
VRGSVVASAFCLLIASCAADDSSIMAIQGEGPRSPVEGLRVTTTGIVTAVRTDGRGFWIQHPRGDSNPRTSDALLIDHLLASPALAERVLGSEIVHGNADDPRAASDHDVPVVRLQFP